jgi:hypothetical protein
VRHAEHQRVPLAVFQADQRLVDRVVAAGAPPDVGGVDKGHQHLLRPDRVHLLADDALEPAQAAQPERQVTVDAGRVLPHVASALKQYMAGELRLLRHLPEPLAEQ